ncbi:MAG: hypothetical protein LBD77_11600 [Bifidobacteriaceae bacterium]|jgi:hypothetical protein|nr:hypothetical protein [Bifidobacteriaceae bacterium]
MSTATLSELLRRPNQIISQTEKGAVTITRRDGADLLIMKAEDERRRREGVNLASAIMRAAVAAGGDFAAALATVFGWTRLLTSRELESFAQDVEKSLWAAVDLDRYELFLLEVGRWSATAETYAAGLPRGDGADQQWLDRSSAVARP